MDGCCQWYLQYVVESSLLAQEEKSLRENTLLFFQWTHYEQSRFIIHWGRVVLTDVPQYVCLIKTNKKKRKPPKIKNKVKNMGKSVNPFRQHILCNICLDNHCMCPNRRKNRRLADHGSLNIFLACVCCHRVVHGRIAI